MENDAKTRARQLFVEALQKNDADEDAALSLYLESLALDRDQPEALYNVGLIYKYRAGFQLRDVRCGTGRARWRIARDAALRLRSVESRRE